MDKVSVSFKMWACGDGKENVFLIKHRAWHWGREAALQNVSGHDRWCGYSLLCWFLLHSPRPLPIVAKHLSVVHEQTWLASVTKCSFFHPFLGAELCVQCNLALFFFFSYIRCIIICLLKRNQRCIFWLKLEDLWWFFIPGGVHFTNSDQLPGKLCFLHRQALPPGGKKKIYYAWGVLTSQLNWSFKHCFKYAQPRIMNPLKECFFGLYVSQSSLWNHQKLFNKKTGHTL